MHSASHLQQLTSEHRMSHTDTNRNIIPCAKYTPVTVIQVLCSYHICIGTSIIEGDYCTLEVT